MRMASDFGCACIVDQCVDAAPALQDCIAGGFECVFRGDVEIQRALEAGARGYLLKSMPPTDLLDVIRQVHAGKKRIPPEVASQLAEHMGDELLTQREIDVLRAVADGNRNRDIAEKLFISEETVKVHIKHIMEKLHASDRTDAVAIAVRRGIIHL